MDTSSRDQKSRFLYAEIDELHQEADRLADRLEEQLNDKRKRDLEILLLKGEIDRRRKYPMGVPPGPSPEEIQEQRKRDAENARKRAELQLKIKEKKEAEPLKVYLREVKANLANDPDYYRKQHRIEAAKVEEQQRRFYVLPEKARKQIAAARELAEAAGCPLPQTLSFKEIKDILNAPTPQKLATATWPKSGVCSREFREWHT